MKNKKLILGIDPGITGAMVLMGDKEFKYFLMPTKDAGKKKLEPCFAGIQDLITYLQLGYDEKIHVVLERAVPFAMGSIHAFNYGRGFAALEIAIALSELPVTYVESHKWTKEMHKGISKDMKPKAKSIIAVKRLFPKLSKLIPVNRNGKMHEGVVDATLLAGYGIREIN